MTRRKTHEEFIKEVESIYGDKLEVLGTYTSNKVKILVKHKTCGHSEYKMPTKLLAGQGCGICKGKTISKAKTKTTQGFIMDLKNNGITNIEVLGEYSGVKEKIHVRNLKCGHEYYANAGNVLSGSGCPICHGIKNNDTFRKLIESKYPGEYIIIGEYVNGLTPIRVKHKCGYEWDVIPKDLIRDRRCPKCITSKGELFIEQYLEAKSIEYMREYTFEDCRDTLPLPFDFMVKIDGEMKLIEFDGMHHFRSSNSMYKTKRVFEHDRIKNEFCSENNIPLLRIPYWWLRTDRIVKELDKFLLDK